MSLPVAIGSMEQYMSEISRFPLISREEEHDLALRYRNTGDIEAAHKLVTANLRFVVKIASEYRNLGFNFIDLIQEGNIGLMKAVKKFDPMKGYRLISYAVWWIRAQIHSFIIKSWSLVKMGTTQAQRKIFAKLKSVKNRLTGADGEAPSMHELASAMNVKPGEVAEMELRMAARDFSLDAEIGEDSNSTHLDMIPSSTINQEEELGAAEEAELMEKGVKVALDNLSEKERFIIANRVMAEKPMTLKELGGKLNISRERVRQIEDGALKKVRGYLEANNYVTA